ncbi:hypothetical protein [Mycolicibacterium goodii]|uniref:Uncharacterized protein n=1 Tax=Mycolicibacterium goodii TaxID=134601 RepID=A0A0K0XDB0_MYCGD|nr:hypothetical protein AFA91_29570 [Mycolicibacterium goodii]
MLELRTKEQALAYLAQMSPTETFEVQPFENGWVCTKVLTPEQISSGQAVGLARLVIDSETAKIYQYPSWSTAMVAQAHMAFKQTGINRAGKQIYPHQWKVTVRRIKEDQETIVYQLTATSLTSPPESTREHQLTIERQGHRYFPTDPLSSAAMVHAKWVSRQNQGVWPETDTSHR